MTKNDSLYKYEGNIDIEDCKKMVQYFPNLYWSFNVYELIVRLVSILLVYILSKSITSALIFIIIYHIFLILIYMFLPKYFGDKIFKNFQKRGKVSKKINIDFYDKYFIMKTEFKTYNIKYDKINKLKETDDNIYLKYGKKIIFIKKEICSKELIEFIKDKLKNVK